MKRRSFILSTFAALCAPALVEKSFQVILTAREGGEVYTGAGASVALAMASLRENIENCTCPFDEYFAEVFAESQEELEAGARRASHWDFSCPEQAYEIELLEGGRVA